MIVETFTIPGALAGTKLQTAVCRMLPHVPAHGVREAFQRRDVKVDGVRAPLDARAQAGSRIQIYLPDNQGACKPAVIYEDEKLIIVDKPAGVSCEPDGLGSMPIGNVLFNAYPGKFQAIPMPCHRLDNPTDGLLILAKDADTRAEMEQGFRRREVHKTYTCLVKGTPQPREDILQGYLRKDAQTSTVTVWDTPVAGSRMIRTGYCVLEAGAVSRLSVTLYTGRTHQIRAQMAHCGHPLLGDDKYGDRAFNRAQHAKRLMLTATALRFTLTGPFAYLNDRQFSVPTKF